MKTWQLENVGKHNLVQTEKSKPEPNAKQILIRTEAVSLNFRDKAIIDGTYPGSVPFPLTIGSEVAGEVVAVGSEVKSFKPGDKVLSVFHQAWTDGALDEVGSESTLGGPLPGTLSEFVLLSEEGTLKYPDYLTPEQASTLSIAAVTAWVGLVQHGRMQDGQTVVVQGSGGVSLFGLQLAVASGAEVIATTRSTDKIPRLLKLGAKTVIDTSASKWPDEVRRLTGGRGADQILDVVGGDSIQHSITASAWGAHIAVIGFMDSQTASLSIPWLIGTNASVQGVRVGSTKDTADLLAFLAAHRIIPVVDAVYSFADAKQAFAHLDKGPFGKVVIKF